jgi:glyceraldehyde 3-phosphate dehydrogenase
MSIKIGINGHIGRNLLRSAIQNFLDIEVITINDLLEPNSVSYYYMLLQYDAVNVRFKSDVKIEGGDTARPSAS